MLSWPLAPTRTHLRLVLLRAAAMAVVLTGTACGSSATHTTAPVAIGLGLKGPRGAHATIYARGLPELSAFEFDRAGRLWVTRSGATGHRNDGLYLVRAAGARPVEVARLRGPLGLVWVGDRLFVSSLDGVDRFSGFNGRAFSSRTRILAGPVAGAENNNIVRAPDGRLLMGVSATCDHCTTTPRYSGAIVSFRADGTGLRIYARGVRAAYGLAFAGSTLYASLNQRDDLGDKTPGDWLAVVKDGQDWGFPRCYGQGGPACAGVPSRLGTLDPHAAAGGIAILNRSALVSEWSFGKVMSVTLGGGVTTTWVSGLNHPLPLTARPDGSVLIGDWGTGIVYRVTPAR
jgi:glucose/arabinose dehydrogenase